MLEEMYVNFDMPDPAFGIQLVYNRTDYPEMVTVVRDRGAVLCRVGIIQTYRFTAIAFVFSGRWLPTAKAKTGSLEWSTCSADSTRDLPD
jgi:5-deoxy-glucuronate isomerase